MRRFTSNDDARRYNQGKVSGKYKGQLTKHRAGPGSSPDGMCDGSTLEKAVVINVSSMALGHRAEYEFPSKKFGQAGVDFTVPQQKFIHHGHRYYDLLQFKLVSVERKSLYFDITLFFGKD